MSIKKILEEFVADLDYLRNKNDSIGMCARYDRALLAIEKELLEGLPKLETRFLSKDKLNYQLGKCEGRKSMLSDCKQSIKKVIRGGKG